MNHRRLAILIVSPLCFLVALAGCAHPLARLDMRHAVISAPDPAPVLKSISAVEKSVSAAQASATRAKADADLIPARTAAAKAAEAALKAELSTTAGELEAAQLDLHESDVELGSLKSQIQASEAEKADFVSSYKTAAKKADTLADKAAVLQSDVSAWQHRALALGALVALVVAVGVAWLAIRLGFKIPFLTAAAAAV